MMEKVNIVRALVTERLTLAAEEIFALVERTIVEYEQELCRCKEENQRKQQLLDSLLITTTPTRENTSQDAEIQTEKQEDSPLAIEEKPSDFTCVDVKNEEQCDEFQPMNLDEEERAENANFIVQPRDNGNKNTNDQMENKSVRSSARKHVQLNTNPEEHFDWTNVWESEEGSTSQTYQKDKSYHQEVQKLSAETLNAKTSTNEGTQHKHECPICQKRLGRKQELKRHILLHTGEKPFSCPVCNKRFIQKSNLKSHIVTHLDSLDAIIRHQKPETEGDTSSNSTGDEKNMMKTNVQDCSDLENDDDEEEWALGKPCSSSFRSEEEEMEQSDASSLERISLLLNQALNENKERKVTEFHCPICDKVFSRMENLRRHLLVHTGEKVFSCSVCGKTFALKQHLKLHMVLHTRDKQFECSVCHKTFIRKDNLRSHMRIHSADRPFGCSDCGARFFSHQDLERHKVSHDAERPFSCTACNASFLTKRHLTRHEKIHKKETQKTN